MADTKVPTDNALPGEAKVVTTAFLGEILNSSEKRDDIVVKDFSVSRATGKGDNFASIVLRVHVNSQIGNEDKEHHLIIKTMYDNQYHRDFMAKLKIADREVMAYKELCPSFIQYQVDKGLEPIRPSVPVFLHSVINDQDSIVVIQDLCPAGYKMANKYNGLDFDHCKLVMKALANFHALSYAMKNGNPENLKERFGLAFAEGFYNIDIKEEVAPWLNGAIEKSVDIAREGGVEKNDEIKERIQKFLSNDKFGIQMDLLSAEEPYAVLCHGDCWCNNLIFKYNSETDNTPTDVKLLDLQVIRYALPTIDLAYFIYTSTTRSLRRDHLTDLLELYHKTFLETLDHVKVKISGFTFEVLQTMFEKTMLFGVISALMVLPSVLCNPEDVPEMKADQSKEEAEAQWTECLEKAYLGQDIKERIFGIFQDAIDARAF